MQVTDTLREEVDNGGRTQAQRTSVVAQPYGELSIDADEALPTILEKTVQVTNTPSGKSIAAKLGMRTEHVNTALEQVGQYTSYGSLVFLNTGAPSNMVADDSAYGNKGVKQKACCVRVKRSCDISTAKV